MQPTYYMWLPTNRWRQVSESSYRVMLARGSKVKTREEVLAVNGVFDHAPAGVVVRDRKRAGKVVRL